MKRERTDKVFGETFDSLKRVPLPDKERQAAQKAAFLVQVRH